MMRNGFVWAISLGAALALPYVMYAQRVRDGRGVYGIGLTAAASIYVVFAAFQGSLPAVLIELSGVALFGILAFVGVRRSAYILALGWAVHVSWDLLLHSVDVSSHAPWWYPLSCLGFDLVVAGAILGHRGRSVEVGYL